LNFRPPWLQREALSQEKKKARHIVYKPIGILRQRTKKYSTAMKQDRKKEQKKKKRQMVN
jgi:hypothetical protein